MHLAEFWYNNTYHISLKMTSFKVIYGYDPLQLSFELVAQTRVAATDEILKKRQVMAKVVKTRKRLRT